MPSFDTTQKGVDDRPRRPITLGQVGFKGGWCDPLGHVCRPTSKRTTTTKTDASLGVRKAAASTRPASFPPA